MIQLSTDDIRIDGGTQSRSGIDQDVVKDYAAAMLAGVEFPPVDVFHDGESYFLVDGFHRHAAAELAELDEICAEVHQGTLRDAILYSVGANRTHGLRRTNEDKRRAVMRLLADEEWSAWSNREIANRCGVDESTVRKYRDESGAGIPHLRKGADGKTYDTTNIGSNGHSVATENPGLPQDADLLRVLTAVAPDRRAVVWRMAVAETEDGQVTVEQLQALVDQLLGKVGRFDNDLYYPVWTDGRQVFNVAGKSSSFYNNPRFNGCETRGGNELNQNRKYDGYTLVELPEFDPPPLNKALPGLKKDDYSTQWPVDMKNKHIYNAPFKGGYDAPQPKETYRGCEWLTSNSVAARWTSLIHRLGAFEVLAAREISTEWLKKVKFQPGMSAQCPECASSWRKEQAVAPYKKWAPIEPNWWCCPNGHRVQNGALVLDVEAPKEPTAEEREKARLEREAAVKEREIFDILNNVVSLYHFLKAMKDKQLLVEEALKWERIVAFRKTSWRGEQLTDEVLLVARYLAAVELEDGDDIFENELLWGTKPEDGVGLEESEDADLDEDADSDEGEDSDEDESGDDEDFEE